MPKTERRETSRRAADGSSSGGSQTIAQEQQDVQSYDMTHDDSSSGEATEYEYPDGNSCHEEETETSQVGNVMLYTVYGKVRREKH